MKRNVTFKNIRLWMMIVCLGTLWNMSQGQEIKIEPNGEGFKFKIVDEDNGVFLGADDLVYYLFSDGYSLSRAAVADDLYATVYRQFTANEALVTAYIARKNGPLEKATSAIVPISDSCSTCQDPYLIMSIEGSTDNQAIKLSTSWNPFSAGSISIESFTHDITNPPFPTPDGEPWFFLNVTIERGDLEFIDKVKIIVPDSDSITGIIVKDKWAGLEPGGFNTTVTAGSVFGDVFYFPDGKIEVSLSDPAF